MNRFWNLRVWMGLGLLWVGLPMAQAQWVKQTLALKPGWNAVFLEVQPEPEECDRIFAGMPVESVWEWNPSVDSAQFVQDPSTLIPGAPGWLTWFAPGQPVTSQNTLSILRDGRAFLIKVSDGAQPLNWVVTGKPTLRRVTWRSGGLNFVGFHVGTPGPTFENLFAGEVGLAGQPVYALDAGGVWRAIASAASVRASLGQAYWVRCAQPSLRAGTIQMEGVPRAGLTYVRGESERSLRIRNTSSGLRTVKVRVLDSVAAPAGAAAVAGPVPLEFWRANHAQAQFGWEPLVGTQTFTGLGAGQEWNLRVGVRWSSAAVAGAGARYQSVLEVTDDLGTRWLIPVVADPNPDAGTVALSGRPGLAAPEGEISHAGVWVGEAVLREVSQPANAAAPTALQKTGGELSYRIIVHVDESGKASLLQNVYLVRKPAVKEPDPDNPGFERDVEPARMVAVTDESLIPGAIGNGAVVGRKISSAAFAFKQPLPMTGTGFGSGTITGEVVLDYKDPLNPFKHLYHPDHDNLDERFEKVLPEGRESFTVRRTLSLEFTATDPQGLNPPGWGDSEVGGNLHEIYRGLHKDAIHVGGYFRLIRVARTASLNP